MAEARVLEILSTAKRLAQEYRTLTGKPLGVTGEVAEYEAARLLGVELTPARQAGYDARSRYGRPSLPDQGALPAARLQARSEAGFHRYREGLRCRADGAPG